MKENVAGGRFSRPHLLLVAVIVLAGFTGTSLLAKVRTGTSINITINNNSQREIRHLYLAAGDPNNWGPDQLNGSTVSPGASYVLSNVTCSGASVRVIAEDQNGCFVYDDASCDGNQAWNITDATTPDCGG